MSVMTKLKCCPLMGHGFVKVLSGIDMQPDVGSQVFSLWPSGRKLHRQQQELFSSSTLSNPCLTAAALSTSNFGHFPLPLFSSRSLHRSSRPAANPQDKEGIFDALFLCSTPYAANQSEDKPADLHDRSVCNHQVKICISLYFLPAQSEV